MIKPKDKPCRGNHPTTIDYGCGKPSFKRTYGLCDNCIRIWAITDRDGKVWLKKRTAFKMQSNAKEEKQKKREQKEKMQLELISPDKYRAKYVQPLINKIARFIDYDNPCIATGNFDGKMAGGHYTSVGSNRTICLNLHNIFIQSFASNSWNGGDDKKYRESLINIFGQDYLDFIEGLKAHHPIKLSKEDLVLVKEKGQKIVNDLEKTKSFLTPRERISMRNTINIELGIYDKEFCIFNI